MKENKSAGQDSNSFSAKKSWLGTDLRNLNGSLHHFDFTNLDPTVADININLALASYDYYGDIYYEIGQQLDYLFSRFELNICFSDNMYTDELGEKFLILNHDCAFSDSKDNLETGEHWKVTDQRWKAPTRYNIPENSYYCYNLQLVNLYNHTSLAFACNVCNFPQYTYTPHFKQDYGSYKWDNGHILPNHVAYVGIRNLNHRSIPSRFFNKIFNYFIYNYHITFDYRFQYVEHGNKHYLRFGSLWYFFNNPSQIIDSPNNVHFSEENWLTEDGDSGYFDRSKVHHLIWSKWFAVPRQKTIFSHKWYACLEYALFANLYLTTNGGCAWVIAGGAWKNTDRFPGERSSIYWQMYITLSKVQITPNYNSGIFHTHSLKSILGSTNYSSFLKLDHKPDYILTSENELYWFYRSSVAFNFFNTGLLDQVIMKQVNEGANQTLVLNHNYTLTKKAGCYQFLVTFHGYYSCDYYGYHYGNTITLNIRIMPDYDFSQGLNAVTLNNIPNSPDNYSPYYSYRHSYDHWVVDIYIDRKTVKKFYYWLKNAFLVNVPMFNFLDNINNFKNFCSFKDHIKFLGLNKDLYKELNNEMTHNHDDLYLDALLKTIEVYWKRKSNYNSGHLHFILKCDHWNVLNSGIGNHFYDKIVQPDQWK